MLLLALEGDGPDDMQGVDRQHVASGVLDFEHVMAFEGIAKAAIPLPRRDVEVQLEKLSIRELKLQSHIAVAF